MNNKEIIVETEIAYQWTSDSLRDPLAMTLSRFVLKNTNLKDFCFTALARGDLSHEDLIDFKHGGEVSGTPYSYDWIYDFLYSKINVHRALIVSEDWQLMPGHKFIEKNDWPVFYHEKDVYVFEPLNPAHQSRYMYCTQNLVPLFHGFVINDVNTPAKRSCVDKASLLEMANNIVAIYIGIYDGESYLVGIKS